MNRRFRDWLRRREEGRLVAASGLFDAAFYLSRNADVRGAGQDPLGHFLAAGGREGRSPHRLFDARRYLDEAPELAAAGINPLVHYLQTGAAQGRRPHLLFDGAWYAATYPEAAEANPLVHFLTLGARQGCRPNRLFDTTWYVACNPDLVRSGTNPLVHYLDAGRLRFVSANPTFDPRLYLANNPDVAGDAIDPFTHFLLHGEAEGRHALPAAGPPVIEGALRLVRRPRLYREMALFSATARDGHLARHVRHHLGSLRRQGIAVMLIVSAARHFLPTPDLLEAVDGLMIRDDDSGDLSAWSHALAVYPGLYAADSLFLVSECLIGPGDDQAFVEVIDRLRAADADVVGLTEAKHPEWLIHPYFLLLRRAALENRPAQMFFRALADQPPPATPPDAVTGLSRMLRGAGLRCRSLFDSTAWGDGGIQAVTDIFNGLPEDPGVAAPVILEPVGDVERQWLRVALIGPWNYNNGQAVAARGYAAALRRAGVLLNLHPVEPAFHIHQRVAPTVEVRDFSGPADVALVLVNPDGWSDYLTPGQRRIIGQAKLSIGLWVWEQDRVPAKWHPNFHAVDAIWAPSRFCADCYATEARVPVHVVPYVVPVDEMAADPGRGALLRRGLGLAAEDRLILYVFDGASFLIRKNPAALVRAFARSGLAESGWRLVLKTKNLFDQEDQGKQLERLVGEAPGVILINRSLDLEMMAELMHAADIYASPHCSEGFGLTVAEAMAMGKIVVATDFAGTRDFLDGDCGFPVRYSLEPIDQDGPVYAKGSRWAQIDEEHLAQSLCLAAEAVCRGDGGLAAAARRRIGELLSAEAVAATMLQSLGSLLGGG